MSLRLGFSRFPAALTHIANALQASEARRDRGLSVVQLDVWEAGAAPQHAGDAPWDADLDFSTPPHLPNADLPRFLAASPLAPAAAHANGERCLPAVALTGMRAAARWAVRAVRSRGPAVVIALLLVLCWRSAGQSDPLPRARNLDADGVAERFAFPNRAAPDVTAVATDQLEPSPLRIDFAPRLAAFYSVSKTEDRFGQHVNGAFSVSEAQPEFAVAEPEMPPQADDVGVVVIRKLAAGSILSAGTRLSDTAWALSPSDLRSVVVTMPPGRHAPINAEIEVFGRSGSPSGTMSVEIRERPRVRAAERRRARGIRPVAVTAARGPAQKKQTYLVAKPLAVQTPGVLAPGVRAATNIAAVPQQPAASTFPQLPFLPGPMNAPAPPPGDTVVQQIMINLGVASRPASPVLSVQD